MVLPCIPCAAAAAPVVGPPVAAFLGIGTAGALVVNKSLKKKKTKKKKKRSQKGGSIKKSSKCSRTCKSIKKRKMKKYKLKYSKKYRVINKILKRNNKGKKTIVKRKK